MKLFKKIQILNGLIYHDGGAGLVVHFNNGDEHVIKNEMLVDMEFIERKIRNLKFK